MQTKILPSVLIAIILLAACKGKSRADYELSGSKGIPPPPTTSVADSFNVTPKLVKTAKMDFKVKNVQQASENIIALTTQYSGMMIHHKMQSFVRQNKDVLISNDSVMHIEERNTIAYMTIKMPAEKLEDFMTKVGHMSVYIDTSWMNIDDKSFDYLSNQLKMTGRQELVDQQKQGKIKIKNPNDILTLKDGVADQQIGDLKINNAVKYSFISLNFYQNDTIFKEITPNNDLSTYNTPILQRMGLAFARGWYLFIDMIVGLINLWVYILIALVFWIGYNYYRKRKRLTNQPAV